MPIIFGENFESFLALIKPPFSQKILKKKSSENPTLFYTHPCPKHSKNQSESLKVYGDLF
jgi:hypothetical protein